MVYHSNIVIPDMFLYEIHISTNVVSTGSIKMCTPNSTRRIPDLCIFVLFSAFVKILSKGLWSVYT